MLSADGLATANWPCPLAATCSVGLNRHLIQIVFPTPSGNGKLIAFLTPDFHAHFGLFGNQFTTPIVYDGEEKPMSMLGISETFVWSVWARIPCRLWDLGLNCAAHSRMTGKGVRGQKMGNEIPNCTKGMDCLRCTYSQKMMSECRFYSSDRAKWSHANACSVWAVLQYTIFRSNWNSS